MKKKINGPLICKTIEYKQLNPDQFSTKKVESITLQTKGLIVNPYYKSISKLCILT